MRISRRLAGWLFGVLARRTFYERAPDVEIGGRSDPYMQRWHVIPRNRFFNIYFHRVLRSDDPRALHDHPWASLSVVLTGGYTEVIEKDGSHLAVLRRTGDVTFRRASAAHRLCDPLIGTFTLFVTGPRIRNWGFYCPQGWRRWQDFCDPKDHTKPGRGCGED